MTAIDPMMPMAVGRLDAAGKLVEADPRLNDLNRRAGGALDAPLAIPQVAALARLAQRLGIAIARSVVAADGEDDVELMVRAEPEAGGVRLEISGWHVRSAWRSDLGDAARNGDFFASGADILWESDAALRLTSVSPDVAQRYECDALALLGQPLTRLFALADDDEGGFPILGGLAAQSRFDGQRATLRGTRHRFRLAATPRTDGSGRFSGFVGAAYFVDDEPEAAVPTATDALTSSFSAPLDRALRAPLGRIIANADSISARAEGPLRQDYAEYATDIASAGRHLLALVDDLADLQAIERPDFSVPREPLDLADVARRAAGLLAVRAGQADVRIDKACLNESLPATGEFRRALQILVNLIGNAVRYSPSGGMVWLRLEREGDQACVIVADQGKGIAPDDHARIFEKFERVDPSEPGGNGLGLYIARRLARAMGGDITVDSAPGQGARFVFTLPMDAA